MMHSFLFSRLLLASLAIFATNSASLADVTIRGVAYELKNGRYEPLGGVRIQAYRNGAPLLPQAVKSDDKTGEYSLTVKEGEPFDVLFYGDDRVPELTMIAGNPNGKNIVNIGLLTRTQYADSPKGKKQRINEKVSCTLKGLPEEDPDVRRAREVVDR